MGGAAGRVAWEYCCMNNNSFSSKVLSNPQLRHDHRTRSLYRSSLRLERSRRHRKVTV